MAPSFDIRADENEAYPGLRVWHLTLDATGQIAVAVTWKTVVANVIQPDDFRQVLLMSETAEVFASVILHEAEDIVGELMRPHVWNCLNREIAQWHRDNLVALDELKAAYAQPLTVSENVDFVAAAIPAGIG